MKTIEQLLRELARSDVSECAIASGCLPCVKVGSGYRPVDDVALTTDVILKMLVATGAMRRGEALGDKPLQWSLRVEGIGTVAGVAVNRDGKVNARFVVWEREEPTPDELEVEPPPRSVQKDVDLTPARVGMRILDPDLEDTASAALDLDVDNPRARREGHAPASTERDFDLDLGVGRPVGATRSAEPAANVPARAMLEELLAAACARRASDVHLVAGRPLLMRVAGELGPRGGPLDATRIEAMILPLLPLQAKETLDRDGSCDLALTFPSVGRFRVNVGRQRSGLKICFRIIPKDVPTLASLGLPEDIAKATHHHQGLIVVTGPTGHGKTSTLAAIVDILNTNTTHHVITVEDPVEYVHPRKRAMMSQREVGTHTRSFQSALKASLREDPDVIVVGELRDSETVRTALSASETGHLVLGTMNTPSAAKTIDRLIDLFPPADQQQVRMTLAGGLRLIVSQRLLPNADGTGRVAAVEVLPGSIPLWSLIRDGRTFQIPSLQQRGKAFGIVRLDESLAALVRAGKTTREAALTVAENPDELDAQIAGRRPANAPPPNAPAPADEKAAGILQRAGSLFGGKKA